MGNRSKNLLFNFEE